MGLLSPFQRKTSSVAAGFDGGDEVQRARSRARQRLIGAVILVGIGIVGFPLLFETHPRPIPVDIPIVIANKDKAPPLAMPPARPGAASAATAPSATEAAASGVITEAAGAAGREVAPRASAPAMPAASAPAPAAHESTAPKPAAQPEERTRAPAALQDKPDDKPAAVEGRYVVQVGAFAESAKAREARQRVEKLGLKTYTQVVETPAGSRIRVRVGPFGTREEADRAAGKLRSAGLPAALLTL